MEEPCPLQRHHLGTLVAASPTVAGEMPQVLGEVKQMCTRLGDVGGKTALNSCLEKSDVFCEYRMPK